MTFVRVLVHCFLLCSSLAHASSAAILGFNYQFDIGSINNWESAFRRQQSLPGVSGFNAARVWTALNSDQSGFTLAIPAAIATNTRLHFSLGINTLDLELTAIKNASQQYQSKFTSLVNGISVGNHVLPGGMSAADVATRVIAVKSQLGSLGLSNTPVGHDEDALDWMGAATNNSANVQKLVDACDFLGTDPSYANDTTHTASDGIDLFNYQIDGLKQISGTKPIWILGYGWPGHGSAGGIVPSATGLGQIWNAVGCQEFFNVTTFYWSCLFDEACSTGNPGFGILDNAGNPLFNLSCDNGTSTNGSNSSTTSTTGSTTATAGPTIVASPVVTPVSVPNGLPDSTKTGIGVGVGVGGAIILVIIGFLVWRRRQKRSSRSPRILPEMDASQRYHEKSGKEQIPRAELSNRQPDTRVELSSKAPDLRAELGSERERPAAYELAAWSQER